MSNKRIKFQKKANTKAFSLAGVLITLTIIGVVAAITIPALMQKNQETQYKTAYKKAFSDISAAFNSAIANNELSNRATMYDSDSSTIEYNAIKKYFKITKNCESNNNEGCWKETGEKLTPGQSWPQSSEKAFVDSSGRSWSLYKSNENIILIDTNGLKEPNQYGKDRWMFTYQNKNNERVGFDTLTDNIAIKVSPFYNNDILTESWICHYPPCYFRSWLIN